MIKFLQTPTRAKKFVLGGLLVVVAVMMVVTLIPGIFDSLTNTAGRGVYARVAGHDITSADVDRAAQEMAREKRITPQFVSCVRAEAGSQVLSADAPLAEPRRRQLHATDE